MQMMVGLFQSSGWPSVVAVVGNWFGKSKRGLIMGISGSLIAAAMLKYGWSWSFAVPGIMIVLVGLSVFLLLPISPDVIGIQEDLIGRTLKGRQGRPFVGTAIASKRKGSWIY
jgi:OPA family glycerol-3-phosphate transporter-like MFS transporter 1/2